MFISNANFSFFQQAVKDFDSKYLNLLNKDINKAINFQNFTSSQEPFVYSYHCHEGLLAFAYALNKTIAGMEDIILCFLLVKYFSKSDLAENETLNREAAEESHLPRGETFTMANFTYANSAVVSRMFEHLQNTMFPGITVSQPSLKDRLKLLFECLKLLWEGPIGGSCDVCAALYCHVAYSISLFAAIICFFPLLVCASLPSST